MGALILDFRSSRSIHSYTPSFRNILRNLRDVFEKRLFGYSSMVFATVLIGFLGFMVWAHHMFTVGLGPVANAIFSVATMAIAVPTGIKIFNWLFTMWGGSIRFTTPMMWAVAFIPSFVMGGVTGVMLASAPADYQFHDNYFVVAHFHYVIVGGVVFGLLAGAHYYWPLMFNKVLNETLGKITFWLFFIGFHLTFFIQHFLGLIGMPRRYYTYLEGQGLEMGNMISSIGAVFMALGTIVLLFNVIKTTVSKEKAGRDPWDGRTLEWTMPAPTPEYNFKQLPFVRGLDPFWIEKREGNKEMTAAEPVGDIHMPNPSFSPFIISLGLFIAAFGAMYMQGGKDKFWLLVAIIGLIITFGTMFLRSVIDDHGYHIHKEDLEDKGQGVMHVDEKLTNETFPAEPEKATLEGKNKFVGFGYFLEAKQYCSLPYLAHI